jgi:hypothetical protein
MTLKFLFLSTWIEINHSYFDLMVPFLEKNTYSIE